MKIFACAALLLASCGGMPDGREQAQTPETKTAVKHGPEIALLKPDPKSGMTVNEALPEPPVPGVNMLPKPFRSRSCRA